MQNINFTMPAEKLGALLLTFARRTQKNHKEMELNCCYIAMEKGNLSFFSSDGGVALRFTVEGLGGDPFVKGVEFQHEVKLFEKMARLRKKKWADVEISILSSGVSIRSLGGDFEMALFTFVDYPLSEPFWDQKFDRIGKGAPPASGWGPIQKIRWSEVNNFNLSVGKGTFAFREGESIFLLEPVDLQGEQVSYFNSASFTDLPALLGAFGNEGTLFDKAPPSIHPPTGKIDPVAFSCQGNDLDGFKIKWELLCNSRVKTKQDTAKSHLELFPLTKGGDEKLKKELEAVMRANKLMIETNNEMEKQLEEALAAGGGDQGWDCNIRVEPFGSDSPHADAGFIVVFVEDFDGKDFYLTPKAWFDADQADALDDAKADARVLAREWALEELILKCPAWMIEQDIPPRVPSTTLEA